MEVVFLETKPSMFRGEALQSLMAAGWMAETMGRSDKAVARLLARAKSARKTQLRHRQKAGQTSPHCGLHRLPAARATPARVYSAAIQDRASSA